MDNNKSNATASSSSGKQGEKKDENFLTKAAHSIRDKVHGLSDNVKEKRQKKTNSDSKKKKKDKDKTKDAKLTSSSKSPIAAAAKKDSSSSSDDEQDSPEPPSRASAAKTNTGRGADKPDTLGSKPPSSTEKKDTISPAQSKTPFGRPDSNDSANKPSDDHKDTAAPSSKPSSSSSKPPSDKSSNDVDVTKKPSPEKKNNNQIHISFYGASTVNDILDRIDQAIEKAKIDVEGGKGEIGLSIDSKTNPPVPSVSDLEKIPKKRFANDKHDEEEKDPIHIDYNQIHKVDDLLLVFNSQPGSRKVILDNAPDDSGSTTIQKQTNPPTTSKDNNKKDASTTSDAPPISTDFKINDTSSTSATSDDDAGSPTPIKSILKTSQNPSSMKTSTKTSSFEDDQIHVNIEGMQHVDDVLEHPDEVVPTITDAKLPGEKRQAPQAPNRNEQITLKNPPPPTQKREAPKLPSSTNDPTTSDKQIISSSLRKEKNSDEDDPTEWM